MLKTGLTTMVEARAFQAFFCIDNEHIYNINHTLSFINQAKYSKCFKKPKTKKNNQKKKKKTPNKPKNKKKKNKL